MKPEAHAACFPTLCLSESNIESVMVPKRWLPRAPPTQTEVPKTTLRNTYGVSPPTGQGTLPKSLHGTLENHTESIESITVTSKSGL